MKRVSLLALGLVFFVFVQKTQACTLQIEVGDVIGPVTLDIVHDAIKVAEKKQCSSILALVNTPGGNLLTTRKVVEEILNSPIPFMCLIYPSGGHAGSAGAIILQACHVSGAMVATNIGAATPISSTGQEMAKDLRHKIINDTTSWLEGITKLRGRNLKFSEQIITEAKAVSAKEAVDLGAIDFLASKKEDFLDFSNGREVKMSEDQTIKVVVGSLEVLDLNLKQKILALTTDPQIAYMLLMGSLGLIYFEITHPGTIVPGVVGGIGLVFALLSLHKLEVTWAGAILIALGLLFMILEAFTPSFGFLGVGGTLAFVLGSIFLFDTQLTGYSVPYTVILPISLLLGIISMGIAYLAFSTRNLRRRGTVDDLVGDRVEVTAFNPKNKKGSAKLNGEIWRIRSEEELSLQQEVYVEKVEGLTLYVTSQKREV